MHRIQLVEEAIMAARPDVIQLVKRIRYALVVGDKQVALFVGNDAHRIAQARGVFGPLAVQINSQHFAASPRGWSRPIVLLARERKIVAA